MESHGEGIKIMMELMLEGRILVVDSDEGECVRLSEREIKKIATWYFAQEKKDQMIYLMGAETMMRRTNWPRGEDLKV